MILEFLTTCEPFLHFLQLLLANPDSNEFKHWTAFAFNQTALLSQTQHYLNFGI